MHLAEPPEPFDWLRSARLVGPPASPDAPPTARSAS